MSDVCLQEATEARAQDEIYWAPSVSAYMEEMNYPSEPITRDLSDRSSLRARAMLVHSE
jgi:hypothetical protein